MSISNAIKNFITKQNIAPITVPDFTSITMPKLNKDQNNRKDPWERYISTCG